MRFFHHKNKKKYIEPQVDSKGFFFMYRTHEKCVFISVEMQSTKIKTH